MASAIHLSLCEITKNACAHMLKIQTRGFVNINEFLFFQDKNKQQHSKLSHLESSLLDIIKSPSDCSDNLTGKINSDT